MLMPLDWQPKIKSSLPLLVAKQNGTNVINVLLALIFYNKISFGHLIR